MGVDALRALRLDELGVILKWTIPSYLIKGYYNVDLFR